MIPPGQCSGSSGALIDCKQKGGPMKHKTWFRLVLKAIGVLTIGVAIPNLVWGVPVAMQWAAGIGGRPPAVYELGQIAAGIAPVAFGLYLFFGGEWIVNIAIPSNRPYCPNCGYDVSKATSGRCPECGVALPTDSSE